MVVYRTMLVSWRKSTTAVALADTAGLGCWAATKKEPPFGARNNSCKKRAVAHKSNAEGDPRSTGELVRCDLMSRGLEARKL